MREQERMLPTLADAAMSKSMILARNCLLAELPHSVPIVAKVAGGEEEKRAERLLRANCNLCSCRESRQT